MKKYDLLNIITYLINNNMRISIINYKNNTNHYLP